MTPEQDNENKNPISRILIIVVPTAVLLLLVGFILLVQNNRIIYEAAHEAYIAGDCRTALPLYQQINDRPAFFGQQATNAAIETAECEAFLSAIQSELSGPEAAINAYESFVATHEDSPLTTPALATIHRLYLDWAETQLEDGNYEEAIEILEKGTADYPALEAETEERLLQTYLAWVEALELAGDDSAALTGLNQLKSNYPQFSAEAEAGIDRLTGSVGQ
jgi:tetratricopeptide (TPR) repeat protein